jgi:hypothetical protein
MPSDCSLRGDAGSRDERVSLFPKLFAMRLLPSVVKLGVALVVRVRCWRRIARLESRVDLGANAVERDGLGIVVTAAVLVLVGLRMSEDATMKSEHVAYVETHR